MKGTAGFSMAFEDSMGITLSTLTDSSTTKVDYIYISLFTPIDFSTTNDSFTKTATESKTNSSKSFAGQVSIIERFLSLSEQWSLTVHDRKLDRRLRRLPKNTLAAMAISAQLHSGAAEC